MSEAFQRGRLARRIGFTLKENPYGKMTYEFEEWIQGWIQQGLVSECVEANEREQVLRN